MAKNLFVSKKSPAWYLFDDLFDMCSLFFDVFYMFVDAKIPRGWREQVPIVCREDTGDLVWVVGLHNPKPFVSEI